uniref:NADH-ubiquinone oxidoreductase chain 2 n=1 Tax=Spadella cephaloptera TaxID=52888 RepID=Q5VB07_9BILA|nr:NADH dehydrogenase subunit 2 [Spadella cephaloptera]AAT08486.1 NADH dehydrogenase subunit 2 [Spadella cephaloptera]
MIFGMIFGLVCAVSSNNWLLIWLGLEINLMSFLPLISQNLGSKKKVSLYFVVQSFGSLLILAVGIMQLNLTTLILIMALSLKMGLIPFHFWVPPLITTMKSNTMTLLSTAQKVSPLVLLKVALNSSALMLLLVMNAMMGGMMVMSSMMMPLLFLFSGTIHLSWLISALNTIMFWEYVLIYMILLSAIIMFWDFNQKNSMQLTLLNFGGIPPFLGFSLKLKTLANLNQFHIPALLTGSCMSLYAYVRLLVTGMMSHKKKVAEKLSPVAILLLIPQ